MSVDLVSVFKALVVILSIQLILGSTRRYKSSLQIQRRIQHFLSGMLVLWCHDNFPENDFLVFLLAGIFFTGGIHYIRLYIPLVQKLFVFFFSAILRGPEKEGSQIPGAVFFLLGNLLAFLMFPPIFCSLTIIAVAVGDPIAGICGVYFASPKLVGNKTLAGTLACGVFSASALMVYLNDFGWCIFFVFAVTSAVAELFSFIDDNLTMPVLFRVFFKMICLLIGTHTELGKTLSIIYSS